jgi:hypothetical protein
MVRNEPVALESRTAIALDAMSETCLVSVAVFWLKSRWVKMSVPFSVIVALVTRFDPSLSPF